MAGRSGRQKLAVVMVWLALAWMMVGMGWIGMTPSEDKGPYSVLLVFLLPAGVGLLVGYILDRPRKKDN
jgi:hypothetical protein